MPRRDGDRVVDAEPLGEGALEALQHRAEREPPRAQHLEHELLLALAERRAGRAGSGSSLTRRRTLGPGAVAVACGWKAYSSESTSASQHASMMFSETPIEPHASLAVGGVEQDARDRAGAVVLVEDPHLEVGQLDLGELRVLLGDRDAQRAVERVDGAVALGRAHVARRRRPRA